MTDPNPARPEKNELVYRLFSRYNEWYLRRHFHAVRLFREHEPPRSPGDPIVFYLNHPSWWDPLICLHLVHRYWPDHDHYSPIDRAQLDRHGFLKKIGLFGIDPDSPQGARRFLTTCDRLLRTERTALWITPQGRFASARERPLNFRPGLGHLLSRRNTGTAVPVALHYAFWTDRHPEALVGFGDPVPVPDHSELDPPAWTDHLEERLESVLDPLLEADCRRDESAFRTIKSGSSGVGGIYGLWQSARQFLSSLFTSRSTPSPPNS